MITSTAIMIIINNLTKGTASTTITVKTKRTTTTKIRRSEILKRTITTLMKRQFTTKS